MASAARAASIVALQRQPERIRNVTIIAHVDHGKTTLADSLVAANGIISERQAGKVRYLDRREDEQMRGITMEAHAVSLVFTPKSQQPGIGMWMPCSQEEDEFTHACTPDKQEFLINLIDSPGHVDFSADVSSAVRLCDGALLVVDVVEGACVQTHAVARVAFEERLKPMLVLNKLDRLITELHLSIIEANLHLHRVLEQVNAIMSGFIRSVTSEEVEIEALETQLLFSPEKGNVVFSSGTDSWGFLLRDFAPLISKLVDAPESEIMEGLWGIDKYWDAKNKRVVTSSSAQSAVPMFAHFVLRNIWAVYEVVLAEPARPKKLLMFLETLSVAHVYPAAQNKDKKSAIRSVMGAWLPCARALMQMVTDCVPPPLRAQRDRVAHLLPESSVTTKDQVFRAIEACDANGPLIAFVSKMIAVPVSSLPFVVPGEHVQDGCTFIALGRIFSGTLRAGASVNVIGPKNQTDVVPAVFPLLMMGGDFTELEEGVPAGNIFAVSGLGSTVLKTATLTDFLPCPSLLKMPKQSAPLLRVSVEPADPRDWEKLSRGLKLLNRADPVLEVVVSPAGEHIISAIGELHLERCLKDLRDVFARVEFKVSEPLASFRETIVSRLASSSSSAANAEPGGTRGTEERFWASLGKTPAHVFHNLSDVTKQQQQQQQQQQHYIAVRGIKPTIVVRCVPLTPEDDVRALESSQATGGTLSQSENEHFRLGATSTFGTCLVIGKSLASSGIVFDAMVSGFHLATRSGPICEEPVRGVVYVVEREESSQAADDPILLVGSEGGEAAPPPADLPDGQQAGSASAIATAATTTSGAIVSSIADAFRRALRCYTEPSPSLPFALRLVEPIFVCSLQCLAEGEQLGNLYSVVSRRRGRVVSEGMVDGTSIFQIEAFIPVIEAYGIADELRKRTSGNASSPQLVFSHWEILDVDPFLKRSTDDELEAEGETVENDRTNNLAIRYMIYMRKRKGLPTGERVVVSAEKERNLSRKR